MSTLLHKIKTRRKTALHEAEQFLVQRELAGVTPSVNFEEIKEIAELLELAVLDLVLSKLEEDEQKQNELKLCAIDAFRLFKTLPLPAKPLEQAFHLLRTSALAVLGDRGADASRMLRESEWPTLPLDSKDWGERTWATILDVWLRLIRKKGWEDRDEVLKRIASLRNSQAEYEQAYLDKQDPLYAKTTALELICLYHLAKLAEIMGVFITDGVVEKNYQIRPLLDTHFDRIFSVLNHTQIFKLDPFVRILGACAHQMVENSIWVVTRAVNSKVTQFVRSLVERGRGDKAIFDVLPPQRRTLAEKGLLGSSRRAVVVSLPTSSGKTLIAQFRILQALNQFEHEKGWVAYLVPTRTLVNQISRQLRRDFSPIGVNVEQVSPALEIDNIEMTILEDKDNGRLFRVLVTTPEKLDLMMRQGWEAKIGRPLTLVVVDEAHNIQSAQRGLKLELLLATINKECQRAQFLLLTPFIKNAREVARWLGGTNSDDVSLALDWQPNDRIIGIVSAKKGERLKGKSFNYQLSMESVHTTRNTLHIDEKLHFGSSSEIAKTYSQVTNQGALAAVAAQHFKDRGPVIVMHARPDWVWSLARRLKVKTNKSKTLSDKIQLVQNFLKLEFGNDFDLVELLSYGIGVHHGGLSDEVRLLMEWLFGEKELKFLVATTTIAQGVNFPVTGVILASHQYPEDHHMVDMPPEDFWNIAGRAGRIGQASLGLVALVADSADKAATLKKFIHRQTGDLNSALIELAKGTESLLNDLGAIVYQKPEWSSFLQYLAHSYRQMGEPAAFAEQIEQVLRGTLGFEKLRSENSTIANRLLDGIHTYAAYIQRPNQPLKLVDSTGFSLQSVNTVLSNKGDLNKDSWNEKTLFKDGNEVLQQMMGVLLAVPELRDNLKEVTGGDSPDGKKLALIVKDWVQGKAVEAIAREYFMKTGDEPTQAITQCGQNLFGKLTHTVSWGLGALLSITGSGLSETEFKSLSNLPSRVFYGVNSDTAVTLRLLGIPRSAANPMAATFAADLASPVPKVREFLYQLPEAQWEKALGTNGKTYRKIWRILEGERN